MLDKDVLKKAVLKKLTSVKYGYEEYVGLDLESFGTDTAQMVVETFRGDTFIIRVNKLFDSAKSESYYQVVTTLNPLENGMESSKVFNYYPPFGVAQVPLYGSWIDDRDETLSTILETNKITRGLVDKAKANFDTKAYVEYFI